MKITAEFNSTEELLSFIGTFGNKAAIQLEGAKVVGDMKQEKKSTPNKKEPKVQHKKEEIKVVDNKKEIPIVEAEEIGQDITPTEIKEAEEVVVEEIKVTKEEVRAVFSKLVKAGKQKQAKELTAKYGASKIPDIKEEDYAAIIREAEELL